MKPIAIQKRFNEEDKLADYREAFKKADHDFSGTLSITELYTVLTKMGTSLSREELVNLIVEKDKDRSGTISIDEFIDMLTGSDKFEYSNMENK